MPTPVGPTNRNEPTGFCASRSPARDSLIDVRDRVDRRVLAVDDLLEVAAEVADRFALLHRDALRRDARDPRDRRFDVLDGDPLALGESDRCAGLVEHVDRLVGELEVREVLGAELRRGLDGLLLELELVVLLVAGEQPVEDERRVVDRRLFDLDGLEAARQCAVLPERLLVLPVRRRADAAELARLERGLEHVRRVHRAAAGGAGADEVVDLVDEEDRVVLLLERFHDRLHALFEVAAVACAGEQCAEVERPDRRLPEVLGCGLLVDRLGEAFDDRGLADAGVTEEQRIVLPAPREDVDDALELGLAADQRIDLAGGCARDELGCVGLERIAVRAPAFLVFAGRHRLPPDEPVLADAVRHEARDGESGDALLLQQMDGEALGLAEELDQDGGAVEGVLAGMLDLHRRALEHALECQGLDRRFGLRDRELLDFFLEVLLEVLLELFHVSAARGDDLCGFRIVQEREQDVLEREVLVPPPRRLVHGTRKRDSQFFGELHSGSVVTSRGYPESRARRMVVIAFDSATS